MCTRRSVNVLVSVVKTYVVVMLTVMLPQNNLFISFFVIFMHSRRKGGNMSYKYIGKMFDSYPGCTWETVVIVVMLNLKAESFDASAL